MAERPEMLPSPRTSTEVADPPQQAVRDTWRTPGAFADARRALVVDADAEDLGGTGHDLLQLHRGVEVQASDEPEAVAEGGGDQSGAGRGPDQGEAGQIEADRAGGRALADQDVELGVLHGGVEDFLHRPVEPVDLVDEQHVAHLEVGQQGG